MDAAIADRSSGLEHGAQKQVRFGEDRMKNKSKAWSRAVAVLVAGILVGTKACAESPWSPRVLLDKGDDAVLTAPEAWFSHEIRRIKVAAPQFATKIQETTAAELGDLSAALRQGNT